MTKKRPRELVEYETHKRYVRRDEFGQFTSEQVSVGKSLTVDRRKKAKRKVKKGYGDRGDR